MPLFSQPSGDQTPGNAQSFARDPTNLSSSTQTPFYYTQLHKGVTMEDGGDHKQRKNHRRRCICGGPVPQQLSEASSQPRAAYCARSAINPEMIVIELARNPSCAGNSSSEASYANCARGAGCLETPIHVGVLSSIHEEVPPAPDRVSVFSIGESPSDGPEGYSTD